MLTAALPAVATEKLLSTYVAMAATGDPRCWSLSRSFRRQCCKMGTLANAAATRDPIKVPRARGEVWNASGPHSFL